MLELPRLNRGKRPYYSWANAFSVILKVTEFRKVLIFQAISGIRSCNQTAMEKA